MGWGEGGLATSPSALENIRVLLGASSEDLQLAFTHVLDCLPVPPCALPLRALTPLGSCVVNTSTGADNEPNCPGEHPGLAGSIQRGSATGCDTVPGRAEDTPEQQHH
jgi:hypothetical protein